MSKHTAITQSQSHFASAVHADIKRSTFYRNSTRKTTYNAGRLVPVYVDEVLPGDTMEMTLRHVTRLMTLRTPTMDVLHLDFYAFFVPNRIVWDLWEELHGENKTSAWVPQNPPALVPIAESGSPLVAGKVGCHYGLPVGQQLLDSLGTAVSVLPFRGYGSIKNEWFRDQNLEAPIIVQKGNSGVYDNFWLNADLFKVTKKHDLFTSCLPAPQKGESALIPVEFNRLIPIICGDNTVMANNIALRMRNVTNGEDAHGPLQSGVGSVGTTAGTTQGATLVQPSNLWGDARGIRLNSSTIHELRTAFQIQKLYERDARGGTRYIEMLKAHFGVDAQDYRLQRPEFLGHMHTMVGVQQVPQTSATEQGISPQGHLAAYSYTSGDKVLFKKSFVEHGFIHIFAVARHPKTYQQGIEKMWSRRDRFDFYYPALAHISEQPIYNKEIYVGGSAEENNGVFGYNEAWAQYRYKPNSVAGQFRSNLPNGRSLDVWHYADYYTSRPLLSAEWIQDNSDLNVDRTLAVGMDIADQIMSDIAFICKCTRPMPTYSVPGFVDHF